MEETRSPGRRRNAILVTALVAICIVAVVVPVAVLRGRNGTNGENTVDLGNLEDALLGEHQGSNIFRMEEEVLLSDLYLSDTDLVVDSLEDAEDMVLSISNSTNSTYENTTYYNTTSSPAPTTYESPNNDNGLIEDLPFTPSPTFLPAPKTASPTTSPTDTPTTAPVTSAPQPQIATTVASYQVLEVIDHDVDAFTQGLTFDPQNSDIVYESTGLYGQSDVRKVDITTGEVKLLVETPFNIFGEGLAYYTEGSDGRLIHITWQSQRGFIFDADTLETLEEFQFFTERNEGWGITYVPTTDQFIVTDGSNYLHFWDRDLQETARIPVMMQFPETSTAMPVRNLNEIEWDKTTQTVLANIWQTDYIVRIDPVTGRVVTRYDMSQLYTDRIPQANVLNGIALSGQKDLWVTGKKWPHMYRIVFNEKVGV